MIRRIKLQNTAGELLLNEDIGADGINISISVDGLSSDNVQDALSELLDKIGGLSGTTSGIIVDGVGEISKDMGNISAGTNIDGLTLSQVLLSAYGAKNKIKLLHLSDTHGGTACINACIQEAKDDTEVAMVLHTGDIGTQPYNIMLDADCEQPVLGILGNHDAWDTYSHVHEDGVAAVKALNGNNVTWGTNDNSYWYKDVVTEAGKTIRFIALNEYDYSNSAAVAWIYTVCYTQAQMEWFLNLLHDTPSDYFIVLVVHMPVHSGEPSDEGWTCPGRENMAYSGPDATWLPRIIHAYKNRTIFSGTLRFASREALNFSVEKDFSDLEASATFLCYLAGHAHCDWCGHLPDYPDQLILDVTRADTNAVIGTDDVDRSEITYAANKVTFDLTLRKIVVERIGSTSLVGGGSRSKIEFGF